LDDIDERGQPAPFDEDDELDAGGNGDDDYADDGDAAADDADEEFEGDDYRGNGAVRSGSPDEDLRRLVYFLATNLVDDPENVVVEAQQRGQLVSLTLRVPEHELGKVIGRQGRIARAIRTILTIAGSRYNLRASLDIEG
jgi:predicted RNA-binding protein YlqC (UPF0109 family)